jgi:hypothetical protein
VIALIQIDDDHARIFLEKLLRFGGGAVALRAETQLVARAIPDERRNRTVLRREERQSRAIKSHQAPSSAIKRRTGRQTSARNQEQSRAIKRHQAPSSAVPDAKPVLDDDVREPLLVHEDECLPNKATHNRRRESEVRSQSHGLTCPN